ncbi:hypothetical protein [Magnetospirillum molischianum]|uniref:Uncharacterized protein n=1 Tax=Magnetospirillum molischianum DSM 120 TaxID=1150626 RepID=H8FP42_MAGML|nr:hypothetical protein [Magnetospirillum molischianum]CCG40130.1 conserved hypothetical protein [Magnetospirillum molischianum DSM 120]
MALETLFICQPYAAAKRGALKPQPPVSYKTEDQAVRRAQRMMDGGRVAGVDVVRQTADTEAGDYDEPIFVMRLGDVPRIDI